MIQNSLHNNTPILKDFSLSKKLGKNIYFKMDCYQPTKSFKIRGIGYVVTKAKQMEFKRIISSSGGNAGYACAYAGLILNLPVDVIVPKTTSNKTIQALEKINAHVTVHGNVWDEANEFALNLSQQNNDCFYVHPFDNPDLWIGHSSIITECTLNKPDAVILSVGGGGLLLGVSMGLNNNNWSKTDIIAVETLGAASLYHSMQAKKLIRLDKIESKASSLGAKTIAQNAFDLALNNNNIHSVLVSDEDCQQACDIFLQEHKCLVELACGASLSIVYKHSHILEKYNNILVIVCGGINT